MEARLSGLFAALSEARMAFSYIARELADFGTVVLDFVFRDQSFHVSNGLHDWFRLGDNLIHGR